MSIGHNESSPMKAAPDKLLLAVDLAGTFVFGLEGAVAGVRGNLDALGLMVVAFATALGGGLVRDLLIGSVPPNAIRDVRYGLCAFAGAAVVFFLHPFVQQVPEPLLVLIDAAGLSLFAIAGARKALDYNIPPFSAVLMGGITGVGGGTIRDLFLAQVPAVLRTDIYAVAALLGAALMVIGVRLKLSPAAMALVGGLACFTLRMVSYHLHWNLPRLANN